MTFKIPHHITAFCCLWDVWHLTCVRVFKKSGKKDSNILCNMINVQNVHKQLQEERLSAC